MFAHEPARRVVRVSLTPLIDVVFILLLFFMLSSTFARQQQIEFRAAAVTGSSSVQGARRMLLASSTSAHVAGRVYATDSAAFAELLERWRRDPTKLTVAASADVEVQHLVALLDRLRAAGVVDVDLAGSVAP